MKNNKKGVGLITLIFALLVIAAVFTLIRNNSNSKFDETKIEIDINNIAKPISANAAGIITKQLGGYNVEITYVAKYSISGRVVDVQKYYGSYIREQLSPMDVGLSWGFLAQEQNHKKVKWSSTGNRYLSWYVSDETWFKEVGGKSKITSNHSNNHLLPSNDEVEKLISKIKEDDYIKIDGYLVNIYCSKSDGTYFKWKTSTSRNDSGNGACEVIYVNNITWLK